MEIVKAGTVGNVRIIDHAVVPMLPAKPKVGFILALSLLLGLMLLGCRFGQRSDWVLESMYLEIVNHYLGLDVL